MHWGCVKNHHVLYYQVGYNFTLERMTFFYCHLATSQFEGTAWFPLNFRMDVFVCYHEDRCTKNQRMF